MQTEPAWTAMPAAAAATEAGDIGTLLRVARTASGLTLEEAGQRTGYSAATMSGGRTADGDTGPSLSYVCWRGCTGFRRVCSGWPRHLRQRKPVRLG
jgi:hypothetical protein